jgi:coproporphyrinogen III oxidase-like Fe-S oxidoreductase
VEENDAKFEFIMLALRTSAGLSMQAYKKAFGSSLAEDFPVALKKTAQYLDLDGDILRIKDEYLYVQNSILVHFMEEER